MARGRMISSEITWDKKVAQLKDDTSRLAFTWLITKADVEGRTQGDPAVVRSLVFPRRDDITIQQMENYIKQWAELGLIVWYEANDDMWIWFPKFTEHNKVNRNHEAQSRIPEPPDNVTTLFKQTPDKLQTNSEQSTSILPLKLNQVKLNQVKLSEGEIDESTPFDTTRQFIETLTGLPAMPQSIKAIDEIVQIGCSQEDITAGYRWYQENTGRPLKYYGQLVGPARTAMAQRLRANNTQQQPGNSIVDQVVTEVLNARKREKNYD